MWYFTAELVPLALWSNYVPANKRHAIADCLLAVKQAFRLPSPQDRLGLGFGKPKFQEDITLATALADLLVNDLWYTFQILQIESQFLTEDVSNWSSRNDYQAAMTNIEALNVINNCAERGVKLSTDFLSTSKTEERNQNVFQVVEEDRRRQSNLHKCKTIL